MASGFLTPAGTDPEEIDRRKKYAQSLLMAGTDASPVRHPLQAVARALQGGLGGYLQYQAGEESKAEQAKAMAGLMMAIQGTPAAAGTMPTDRSAPAVLPSQPSWLPGAAASPAARSAMPPAGPTGPIVTDKPYNGEGVIQGNLSDSDISYPSGGGVATVPRAPQVPQQAPTMPPAAGGPPPNTGAVLTALSNPWLGKSGQGIATAIAGKLLTPKDQWQPITLSDGTPGQRNAATGEIKGVGDNKDLAIIQDMQRNPAKYGFSGPDDPNLHDFMRKRAAGQSISTTVQNVSNPVTKQIGEDYAKRLEKARGLASETIPSMHEARKALDEGAITGFLAQGQLGLARIGAFFGLDPSKAVNTEVLSANLGQEVLNHAKELGANPSNADRDFIKDVVGGRITLNADTIGRLLDIREKLARQAIRNINADSKKLIDAEPDAYRGTKGLMSIPEPMIYVPPRREVNGKLFERRRGEWYEVNP